MFDQLAIKHSSTEVSLVNPPIQVQNSILRCRLLQQRFYNSYYNVSLIGGKLLSLTFLFEISLQYTISLCNELNTKILRPRNLIPFCRRFAFSSSIFLRRIRTIWCTPRFCCWWTGRFRWESWISWWRTRTHWLWRSKHKIFYNRSKNSAAFCAVQ